MNHQFIVLGPPIPFTRTTTKSKFVSKQWQRYAEYKDKIVASFLDSISDANEKRCYWNNYQTYGKPILYNEDKIYVLSEAYFKDKRHGDMDNINKGALDALFINDKLVVGAFNFHYDTDNPRLEIIICDKVDDWKSTLRKVDWE